LKIQSLIEQLRLFWILYYECFLNCCTNLNHMICICNRIHLVLKYSCMLYHKHFVLTHSCEILQYFRRMKLLFSFKFNKFISIKNIVLKIIIYSSIEYYKTSSWTNTGFTSIDSFVEWIQAFIATYRITSITFNCITEPNKCYY
jgi:hypothetical protein